MSLFSEQMQLPSKVPLPRIMIVFYSVMKESPKKIIGRV